MWWIVGGETSCNGYWFMDVSPPVLRVEMEWSCPLMWCLHCGQIMQLVVTVVLSDCAICLCVARGSYLMWCTQISARCFGY